MRGITKRRLIWVVIVIVLLWVLTFVVTNFILPGLVEVPGYGSVRVIRDAVTSGVVLWILTTIVVLIIWIVVIDGIVGYWKG